MLSGFIPTIIKCHRPYVNVLNFAGNHLDIKILLSRHIPTPHKNLSRLFPTKFKIETMYVYPCFGGIDLDKYFTGVETSRDNFFLASGTFSTFIKLIIEAKLPSVLCCARILVCPFDSA